ncbi:MAG: efflux RND transporter permease subunit, partial [Planctomycetota bacterium]
DPEFDATTLQDFVDRRVKPRLERVEGVSEVGFLGAVDRELRIVADPARMASRGITYGELVARLREENGNFSGGKLPEGKADVRVRTVGRFSDVRAVEEVVLRRDDAGQVLVRDVAEVHISHKERTDWVRSRGHLMPFFNFQLEKGANLLETMSGIDAEIFALNAPGGLLEREARRLGVDGTFELVKQYDATDYVRQALALVRGNIVVGGALATLVLLLFLRSFKVVGIVALAIPISIVAGIVVLVALGRTINIVSLAGMAFAVGMVVDNAIVVVENVFRHLELGKAPRRAAVDGATEVGGAVLASTLTTVVVFVPVLLIEDSAGQLFRDIALAIVASVGASLIVSLTLIPSAAAALGLRGRGGSSDEEGGGLAARVAGAVGWLGSTPLRRAAVVTVFALGTVLGIRALSPPLDYLPSGNRNIAFGIMFTPPGYNLQQLYAIGDTIEDRVRPFYEASPAEFEVERRLRGDAPLVDERHPITLMTGEEVTPPPISSYFLVGFAGQMFHGAISTDPDRAVDAKELLSWAAAPGIVPDVFSFALQFPIFNTGGTTGSAISVDLTGADLESIVPAAGALLGGLIGTFGPYQIQPDPANFNLPAPELRFLPRDERLRAAGLSRRDLGLAVQANGDGILVPRQFAMGGELKDLKIVGPGSESGDPVPALLDVPLAAPAGGVVDLGSVAHARRVTSPDRIKRVDRQRAVSLQVTPPEGMPLEEALGAIETAVGDLRAAGAIPPSVDVRFAGSAGKLADIREALVGDGSFGGLLTSSLFLALTIVYLLMVVLFQSFLFPLVILVSVPLATLGGFMGLRIVHDWSEASRYVPVQNLDVLTILGFVILAGVVVNNAILIVHQALHFVRRDGMEIGEGVRRAVRTRVRPIAMGTLTSVGGMLPLVLAPGSGSELYRGLGAVVVGGLVVSTVFTLVLVPLLLGGVMRVSRAVRAAA